MDDTVVNHVKVLSVLEGGELIEYASYVLIAVGGFVLIVGFFGCCGAIKENKCMLGMVWSYVFMFPWEQKMLEHAII